MTKKDKNLLYHQFIVGSLLTNCPRNLVGDYLRTLGHRIVTRLGDSAWPRAGSKDDNYNWIHKSFKQIKRSKYKLWYSFI